MVNKLMTFALYYGVVFFLVMGTAHFFGIKVPPLFVYWDPPYFAYQDKIISFTLLTYAALFLAAARHRVIIPYALFSIFTTCGGLAVVTVSEALDQTLTAGTTTTEHWTITWQAISESAAAGLQTGPYWAIVGILFAYALTLLGLYLASCKEA